MDGLLVNEQKKIPRQGNRVLKPAGGEHFRFVKSWTGGSIRLGNECCYGGG